MPTALISYSHDSEEHRAWALRLSERLRADGVGCEIDQYVAGSPPEGWPRWMLNQLDAADFVITICTETYYLRFRGHETPNVGAGVTWEGLVITQELYDAHGRNVRFLPALVVPGHSDFVPEPLRASTRYVLDSEPGYLDLLARLHGEVGVVPGPIVPRPRVPRSAAAPLTFPKTAPTTPRLGAMSALRQWREKREVLQTELATVTGTRKFALQKDLDEAEAMITKFGG